MAKNKMKLKDKKLERYRDKKLQKLRSYFSASKISWKWYLLLIVIGWVTVQYCLYVAGFQNASTSFVTLIFAVGVVVYRLVRSWMTKASDDEIRRYLNEDIEVAKAHALRATADLRPLANEQPNPTKAAGMFVFSGIVVDSATGNLREGIPHRLTEDGFILYAVNRVIVVHFTEYLVHFYHCDYNSLEPVTEAFMEEEHKECFFTDVVSFASLSRSPRANAFLVRFHLIQLMDRSQRTEARERYTNDVETLHKRLGLEKDDQADERQMHQQMFVVSFRIGLSSGEQFGTSFGVYRAVDPDTGASLLSKQDREIESMRRYIRDFRRMGLESAPIFTESAE